jgi:hypothetical protein
LNIKSFYFFYNSVYNIYHSKKNGGAGGKIKKNEMGWTCGAYGGGESFAQGVGGEA